MFTSRFDQVLRELYPVPLKVPSGLYLACATARLAFAEHLNIICRLAGRQGPLALMMIHEVPAPWRGRHV